MDLTGFAKTGHNVVQDSSANQVSSQTPIAKITSTGEAGEIEGGCFRSIVSFLKVKQSSLMILKWICLDQTEHNMAQDSSATQVSSQTPIATIVSTSETGKIEVGCFCSIASYFENYREHFH